nr:hypothetical protein [Pirellulaceae bacterium]
MGWLKDEIGRPTVRSVDMEMRLGRAEQDVVQEPQATGASRGPKGLLACSLLISACFQGCVGGASPPGKPELVWGRQGLSAGRLMKPRAMAID